MGRGAAAAPEGELAGSIRPAHTAPSPATGGGTAGTAMEVIQAPVGSAGGWDVISEGHAGYGAASSCRILALHHAPSLQHLQFF